MKVEIVNHWNEYLSVFSPEQKDIYYKEEYVRLYETDKDTAACLVCCENGNILLMPFLWRKIGKYYDFETPYGYGGPISNSKDGEWIKSAISIMLVYFAHNNYICGFIRFHPLLNNALQCGNGIDVIFDRMTISIPLVESKEEIWKTHIYPRNRTKIHKAEKNGLKFSAEYDFKSIKEFVRIYEKTMIRVHADKFYFFPSVYYEKIIENLKGNAFLGIVRWNEEIVSAALFMYSNNYGHYHLSGNERINTNIWASNFMLWNAAMELKKLGINELHLGGGNSLDRADPLFCFKKSFSKNESKFYIGRAIFRPDVYEEICTRWRTEHPERIEQYGNRLLCYRY